MGDAGESYDFPETPNFLEKLREGFDIVQAGYLLLAVS